MHCAVKAFQNSTRAIGTALNVGSGNRHYRHCKDVLTKLNTDVGAVLLGTETSAGNVNYITTFSQSSANVPNWGEKHYDSLELKKQHQKLQSPRQSCAKLEL